MGSIDSTTGMIRAMFFPETIDSAGLLLGALRERGVAPSALPALRTMARTAAQVVDEQAAGFVAGLLERVDPSSLFVAGWRTHAALVEAAERTIATPGSEDIVAAATHQISATQPQDIDVLIDDVPVATLHFALAVTFTIEALVAVVRHGDLVAVRSGHCLGTVTVSLNQQELLQRQAALDLPRILRFDPALPLIDHDPPPPARAARWPIHIDSGISAYDIKGTPGHAGPRRHPHPLLGARWNEDLISDC